MAGLQKTSHLLFLNFFFFNSSQQSLMTSKWDDWQNNPIPPTHELCQLSSIPLSGCSFSNLSLH